LQSENADTLPGIRDNAMLKTRITRAERAQSLRLCELVVVAPVSVQQSNVANRAGTLIAETAREWSHRRSGSPLRRELLCDLTCEGVCRRGFDGRGGDRIERGSDRIGRGNV
jgi:hypothetical protein